MYGSASAHGVSTGIPPFSEGQLTEDSEGGRIKVGSSEDRGWLASIADDFRIVIKRDGILDKIGAEIPRGQYVGWLGRGRTHP